MTTYKKSNQHKSNFKLAALMIAGLSIASCKEELDKTTPYGKAKYQANIVKPEIHMEYLNCYPLSPSRKKACTKKVADKYLKPKCDIEYDKYRETFQYEAEKLGFKYFLNNKGLSCLAVLQSPAFEQNENAYLVICSSGEKYYVQFDHDNKNWSIWKGGSND